MPNSRTACPTLRHAATVERVLLVLLLGLGWLWQEHRRLRVVEVFLTTPTATLALATPIATYPEGVRSICAYLVYADSRPGVDNYTYRFLSGSTVFFRAATRHTDVTHGVALDCFDTGGNLPPGRYDVAVLLNGITAQVLPFTVGGAPVRQ